MVALFIHFIFVLHHFQINIVFYLHEQPLQRSKSIRVVLLLNKNGDKQLKNIMQNIAMALCNNKIMYYI